VLGGSLTPEFRQIARRIYLVHLRKYVLGMLERITPIRWIIRHVKRIMI
jgi:hypothetical protein